MDIKNVKKNNSHFIIFIFLLIMMMSQTSAEIITTTITKTANLTINGENVFLLIDNNQIFNFQKQQNNSATYLITAQNSTQYNTTIINNNLINNTQVINYTCELNTTLTNELLQNLTQINNTVNTTFVREIFNKKIEEIQEYMATNFKPLGDKLLECGRDLNDLKLAKGECLINMTNYNSQIDMCNTKTSFVTYLSYFFMGATVLLSLVLFAEFMLKTDNILIKKILKRRNKEGE